MIKEDIMNIARKLPSSVNIDPMEIQQPLISFIDQSLWSPPVLPGHLTGVDNGI